DKHAYILALLRGSLQRVSIADAQRDLAALTKQAITGNQLSHPPSTIHFASGRSPIKHVIYIIKENRTYDQVLGDIAGANGDPSLVMYGEEITPNEHKLAREFGVLDNFYASGDRKSTRLNSSHSQISY